MEAAKELCSMHGARGSQTQLLAKLEAVKRQLLRRDGRAGDAERATGRVLVLCHVATQTVASLVQRMPEHEVSPHTWKKLTLVLETTVMSAFTAVNCCTGGASDEKDLTAASTDWRHFRSAFERLLVSAFHAVQTSKRACESMTVLVRLCVLLACCWLIHERASNLSKAEDLLSACSDFCLHHDAITHLAKQPLLMRAMILLGDKRDPIDALSCFRSAVDSLREAGNGDDEPLHYWYAVTLLQNGLASEAAQQLDRCIAGNYEPVACLSLQALLRLHARDFHEATEKLQRALEVDFAQSVTMFNYALLLGAVNNFEAQQQMLEYFLDSKTSSEGGERSIDRKRKYPGEDVKLPGIRLPGGQKNARSALFGETKFESMFPAQLTQVTTQMVHSRLAIAAMENGNWMKAKKYFEEIMTQEETQSAPALAEMADTARDYIYVLLQCNLPTLALSTCEQFLLKWTAQDVIQDESASVAVLLLHLYKADALLCLERVDECYAYLKQVVEPVVTKHMQHQTDKPADDRSLLISAEVEECHTQLLNNLAVVTACRDGVDAAVAILRDGLLHYPDCLTLKFNLVLLLWRQEENEVACAVWIEARGWNLQMKASDLDAAATSSKVSNYLALAFTYENEAVAASEPQKASFSEHVQGDVSGKGSVSRQQLLYLDALVLNHWRKIRDSRIVSNSLQFVEHLETLGCSNDMAHLQASATVERSNSR